MGLVRGRARLIDRSTVEVNGHRVRAANVLIATGARPELPTIAGVEHALSSDASSSGDRPHAAIVVGGGYIAVEFAGILQGLGIGTTLVVRSRVLEELDHEVGAHLAEKR